VDALSTGTPGTTSTGNFGGACGHAHTYHIRNGITDSQKISIFALIFKLLKLENFPASKLLKLDWIKWMNSVKTRHHQRWISNPNGKDLRIGYQVLQKFGTIGVRKKK
jgi:hypothetical protein